MSLALFQPSRQPSHHNFIVDLSRYADDYIIIYILNSIFVCFCMNTAVHRLTLQFILANACIVPVILFIQGSSFVCSFLMAWFYRLWGCYGVFSVRNHACSNFVELSWWSYHYSHQSVRISPHATGVSRNEGGLEGFGGSKKAVQQKTPFHLHFPVRRDVEVVQFLLKSVSYSQMPAVLCISGLYSENRFILRHVAWDL